MLQSVTMQKRTVVVEHVESELIFPKKQRKFSSETKKIKSQQDRVNMTTEALVHSIKNHTFNFNSLVFGSSIYSSFLELINQSRILAIHSQYDVDCRVDHYHRSLYGEYWNLCQPDRAEKDSACQWSVVYQSWSSNLEFQWTLKGLHMLVNQKEALFGTRNPVLSKVIGY